MQYFYGCLDSTALFHEFPDRAREVIDSCRNAAEESNDTAGLSTDEIHNCRSQCPYFK
jgi:hypothetical protein